MNCIERINYDFCKAMTPPGALARTPIRKSKLAVLGINWGGRGISWSDAVPDPSTAVEDAGEDFAGPILSLLSKCLGSEVAARRSLEEALWTNRILISSQMVAGNEEILKKASEPSAIALRRMLHIAGPTAILCAGNDENRKWESPASFVLRDLAGIEDPWSEGASTKWWTFRNGREWGYYFHDLSLRLQMPMRDELITEDCLTGVDVWVMPHPGRRKDVWQDAGREDSFVDLLRRSIS